MQGKRKRAAGVQPSRHSCGGGMACERRGKQEGTDKRPRGHDDEGNRTRGRLCEHVGRHACMHNKGGTWASPAAQEGLVTARAVPSGYKGQPPSQWVAEGFVRKLYGVKHRSPDAHLHRR